jgi:hypothetical protein
LKPAFAEACYHLANALRGQAAGRCGPIPQKGLRAKAQFAAANGGLGGGTSRPGTGGRGTGETRTGGF